MSSRLADPGSLLKYVPLNNHAKDLIRGNDEGWIGTEAYEEGPHGRSAGKFNGSSYVDLGDITDLDTSDFSIGGWVRTIVAGQTDLFAGKKPGLNPGWFLNINTSNQFNAFFNDNMGVGKNVSSSTLINTGGWFHVFATYDRSGLLTAYVSGEPEATGDISAGDGNSLANAVTLQIGATNSGFHWNGGLADFRIYTVALTALEVKELSRRPVPRG